MGASVPSSAATERALRRAVFVGLAVAALTAAFALRGGQVSALLGICAGTAALAAGTRGLVAGFAGWAAALLGAWSIHALWSPSLAPAIPWLGGSDIETCLAHRGPCLAWISLGWWCGALSLAVALVGRALVPGLVGAALVLVALLLPQAGHVDRLVPAGEAAPVPVLEDGVLVERGWERVQIDPAVPLFRVGEALESADALARIAQGAGGPGAWRALLWSLARWATAAWIALKLGLPLVLALTAWLPRAAAAIALTAATGPPVASLALVLLALHLPEVAAPASFLPAAGTLVGLSCWAAGSALR